ncbi:MULTISPECIES: TfoX/Sxy family protein [Larkinella]|uniref:TfoX/Sxy family protein n=1 Tax=Larkinella humicola TaxID=2607654 RepID=A0A5N1JN70_9BACT|nr:MULTISPECIES: TfoX/Sxy family protein [Larkinella]KAA9356887.1 TfoX/Sxy family protein [Larkinella humicola]
MAYNEKLANRVREELASFPTLEEQTKRGGLSFRIDHKLVVHVKDDELMIRCEKEMTDELSGRPGARPYVMKGRQVMKGWLLIDPVGTSRQADLTDWLIITLAATARAKTTRKRAK